MCWSLVTLSNKQVSLLTEIASTGQLVSYEEFVLVGDPLLMKG